MAPSAAQRLQEAEPPPSEDIDDLLGSRSQRQQPTGKRRVEYYAEEQFAGANLKRSVHIGWGATLGAAIIFFCMGMSAVTQGRSWNVSFLWLQRRVGAQFGTLTYLITSNSMYYHDGDKWVTRDWANAHTQWQRLQEAFRQHRGAAQPISLGFAADAVQKQ